MTQSNKKRECGQAIIMVTLSMVLVFGMLGLVVDLGWGFGLSWAA